MTSSSAAPQPSRDPGLATIARRFMEEWARPNADRLVELLHPDARLTQPVTPEIRGKEAARREFTRLLQWLPDCAGEVDAIAANGDTLLIAWRLRFTVGGRPYELRIVDRIVGRDGLIVEREAYFNSLHFFLTVLRRPSAWLGYLRYRGYLP
ncbi:MAG: nuclear transport factor 2 family protein [Candidatus Binatia bacterium]